MYNDMLSQYAFIALRRSCNMIFAAHCCHTRYSSSESDRCECIGGMCTS